MSLPTGTVTFLFTDIQGSAALAQQYPAELPGLLARHHAILHEAIARHNGHVFQIVGDAFCAAFSTAGDALEAALDAQRALQHEAWEPAPVVVRMGLHTGAAQAREEDLTGLPNLSGLYAGYLTLTRVQRVVSAAYGGQVLLSAATAELLRGHLPPDVTLRDLGENRLKSLLNPEHLWQMVAPDLRQEFPPLPTLNAIPNNLPVQLTSFIGREQEIAEVARLLDAIRLLTLTGAGGAGKTRLSLEVAAEVLDTFKDGAWFVEMAPLSDPDLIPYTVAGVLGLREAQSRPLMETLLSYLESRQLLLILDNCEHLIEGCARFADAVLHACRDVRVLATSREPLGIAGESTWRVPSLLAPDPKAALPAEQLEQYAAVQLFIVRATSVQPEFRVTNANAPAVAQLCWRLDGIPLAIELAAARARALSAEQIAARLDDRFRLLTGGGRTALPRHQTLRATLDWSYGLLSDSERILFRRLAVFAGGWTLEAAESVCADQKSAGNVTLSGSAGQVSTRRVSSEESPRQAERDSSLSPLDDGAPPAEPVRMTAVGGTAPRLDAADVLDLLCRLVDKSLVTAEPRGGEERYRMLETIREYALEKLREAGEEEVVRGQHYRFCRALGEFSQDSPALEWRRWTDRLEVEHDNLRAALRWLLDRNEAEAALDMWKSVARLWTNRGHWTEGRTWCGRVIAASRRFQADQKVSGEHRSRYAWVLDLYGSLATWQGDFGAAQEHLVEALAVQRELDSKAGVSLVLDSLGTLAKFRGDAQAARLLHEESLALLRELGDKGGIADELRILGIGARERGDYAESESLLRESVAIMRELGWKTGLASAVENLGWLALIAGDYASSQAFADESLALRLEMNAKFSFQWSFMLLGYLAWRRGELPAAREWLQKALADFRGLGSSSYETSPCLIACGAVDVSEGHLARGVRLLGAIAAENERTGRGNTDIARLVYDETLAAARAQMDSQAFEAAWAAGRALTMAQAMEIASQA